MSSELFVLMTQRLDEDKHVTNDVSTACASRGEKSFAVFILLWVLQFLYSKTVFYAKVRIKRSMANFKGENLLSELKICHILISKSLFDFFNKCCRQGCCGNGSNTFELHDDAALMLL